MEIRADLKHSPLINISTFWIVWMMSGSSVPYDGGRETPAHVGNRRPNYIISYQTAQV